MALSIVPLKVVVTFGWFCRSTTMSHFISTSVYPLGGPRPESTKAAEGKAWLSVGKSVRAITLKAETGPRTATIVTTDVEERMSVGLVSDPNVCRDQETGTGEMLVREVPFIGTYEG